MVAAVVIGGVFLAGMVAAAGYAAWTLPTGARVPLNVGVPEFSFWLSKPAGLAAWLGAGVVTFAAFASVTLSAPAANWAASLRVVLLPCAMMIVLAAEAGAVILARRRADDQAPAEMPAEPDAASLVTEPDAASFVTEPDAASPATEPDAPVSEPDAPVSEPDAARADQ